jgi:Zn-dependent metalloprotease
MQNIIPSQEILLQQLQDLDIELMVEWDEARGVASFVRGRLTPEITQSGAGTPEGTLQGFLKKYGELFGPKDINNKIKLLRIRKDDLGYNHLEFQQMHPIGKGKNKQAVEKVEVYASKLVAHFMADGSLTEVQSSCWREIELAAEVRLTIKDLQEVLTNKAANAPGFRELQLQMQKNKEKTFPVMQEPRLVVYWWQGGFRLAWATYAYGSVDVEDNLHKPTGAKKIDLGQVFVDADTGEQFLFAPMSRDAETADTGSGLSTTPLGGTSFISRNLNIVRVDTSSTYRLRDTTHARDIITYDSGNSENFDDDAERRDGLNGGTLPISADTDGDKNWNRTPTSTTVAERTASQQPEVDCHHFVREAYEWYNALAGSRAGWDDGQYPNPPVPPQTIRSIVHARDGTNPSSINAAQRLDIVGGRWLCWLQFYDGDGTRYSYIAGSKWLVGHEYQHAITDFNFTKPDNSPGFDYSGWFSAVHEGLSDVFAGLFAEQWLPATEISPTGLIWRNLVFPRDTAAIVYDRNNLDHFDDRNILVGRYQRGMILAHCAFLMGDGGVHQRATRTPVLIPVYSLGRQVVNGKDVLKAARIWYRAITYYFSTHGTLTGVPTNDENTFRSIRNACESAARDIYGVNSLEHRTTVLAFYAVGLHPVGQAYGADVTFLRWGASWRLSRNYIGLPSPSWSSRDLFINNGGTSEWNALINIIDSAGNPTQFENSVYCRVRNVGDRDALNVRVQFSYAKAGTSIITWLPVTDRHGTPQTLNLGTLATGQANFPDSSQNSPPASTSIKWYIPPLSPGETVNHFCLKATVTSDNDVNAFNNDVQSNIAYARYAPSGAFSMAFMAGNPMEEEIPLELQVSTSLPKGWKVRVLDVQQQKEQETWLKPAEEIPFKLVIDMPPGADKYLQPPFDGDINGELFGFINSSFYGTLTETNSDGEHLEGRLAANMEEIGTITGIFEGKLNTLTHEIKGRLIGGFQSPSKDDSEKTYVGLKGCLRPWRRLDISQVARGQAIGGITVQVQVPNGEGICSQILPPTDTNVVLGRPVVT